MTQAQKIVLLLTGPNLDQLGTRDPTVYGTTTLEDLEQQARAVVQKSGYVLEHVQSAAEADIVAAIHRARNRCAAIVINGGAFTHYSWAIGDALFMFDGPIVELHITQVVAREPWRHTSVIAPAATALIAGLGPWGYEVAAEAAVRLASSHD
jgi:3-dehydroquinate dehydratase-2